MATSENNVKSELATTGNKAKAKQAKPAKQAKGKQAKPAKGAAKAKPAKQAKGKKTAKGNGSANASPRGTGQRFSSDMKISLVAKAAPHREGATVSLNAWKILQKCKTVGDYSAAYAAAKAKGMEIAGNYLQWAAAKGHIRVS